MVVRIDFEIKSTVLLGLTCIVLWKTHNSLSDKWRAFLIYKERDFKCSFKKKKKKKGKKEIKETYMNNSFPTMHFFLIYTSGDFSIHRKSFTEV